MGLLEAIILSVLAASTPLLLAAAGELVAERAGVLNLGIEGMMIMGAACGFAGAYFTGSVIAGGPRADHFRHRPVRPDWRRLRRREHRDGASSLSPAAHRPAVRRQNRVRSGRLRLRIDCSGDRHPVVP